MQTAKIDLSSFEAFERRRRSIHQLQECSRTGNLGWGRAIHEAVTAAVDHSNVYVASALISMYSKCGTMEDACRVFDEMEWPNVVCWNALILGYAENGQRKAALDIFSRMKRAGCIADERTFVAALKSCIQESDKLGTRRRGSKLHLLAAMCGCDLDTKVEGIVVDMYAKCGSMEDARRVFDRIRHLDVVSWTALIMGYAENGEGDTSLDLLLRMRREGCAPNTRTCIAAIKACTHLAENGSDQRGRKLHMLASGNGWDLDIYVQGTLVDMYSKSGSMENARRVFDSMKHPDVVSWTALILGYADNGEGETALDVFSQMRREACVPNARTFVAAIKACSDLAVKEEGNGKLLKATSRKQGKELHRLASESAFDSDVYVRVSLVDMYAKCGSMEEARAVFDNITRPSVVCCNALISGYADNGEAQAAVDVFSHMGRTGCAPDAFTFSGVLKACGVLGALDLGKSIHAEINSGGLKDDAFLTTCLVDFYAKCGCLGEAEQMFDLHTTRDLVSWNALMAGYSCHGDATGVFSVFAKMLDTGLKPESTAFNCVLATCSHAGLVDKGKNCFEAMTSKYGLVPGLEHYSCMVDLFGRSNKLDDALTLLRSMPFSPNAVIWTTVLGACQKWNYTELGRLAFESVRNVDNQSNVYINEASAS